LLSLFVDLAATLTLIITTRNRQLVGLFPVQSFETIYTDIIKQVK